MQNAAKCSSVTSLPIPSWDKLWIWYLQLQSTVSSIVTMTLVSEDLLLLRQEAVFQALNPKEAKPF